jgi:Raf kinase inhibitor-like YbhB/YbcL family protein
MKRISALIVFLVFSLSCFAAEDGSRFVKLSVSSRAFKEGGMIPSKFTCKGANLSPPIAWTGVPRGTKSFVLICNDPDAPNGNWIHWIVYNIPSDVRNLAGNYPKQSKQGDGTLQAKTSFGTAGYGGPCPPAGVHRYFFSIYALDTKLDLDPGTANYMEVVKAMQGHVKGFGQVMGRFKK